MHCGAWPCVTAHGEKEQEPGESGKPSICSHRLCSKHQCYQTANKSRLMHSASFATGGITMRINAAWSMWLWAAPASENATSWVCLGEKHGHSYGAHWSHLGVPQKNSEYGWCVCWAQGRGISPLNGSHIMENICFEKYLLSFRWLSARSRI